MTVPSLDWVSTGIAQVRLPLPDPNQKWPIPCRVVVDTACLCVDPNSAVQLHMNALKHELDRMKGIEIVPKSWRANLAHSTELGKVLIVTCLVQRVQVVRTDPDTKIIKKFDSVIGWKE